MDAYLLTAEADADLDNIFDYTSEQWGLDQAHQYLLKIEECVVQMVNGNARIKDVSDIVPGMRRMLCQHHYIFCLPREGKPALIVAILHERMDLMARIADRLK